MSERVLSIGSLACKLCSDDRDDRRERICQVVDSVKHDGDRVCGKTDCSFECDDVLRDGAWQQIFTEQPEALSPEEKKAWIATQSGVSIGSDAFFPFGDNVERARKSGVAYIAEPGGSIRDDNVIETANKYGIAMAFTGMRLFHH